MVSSSIKRDQAVLSGTTVHTFTTVHTPLYIHIHYCTYIHYCTCTTVHYIHYWRLILLNRLHNLSVIKPVLDGEAKTFLSKKNMSYPKAPDSLPPTAGDALRIVKLRTITLVTIIKRYQAPRDAQLPALPSLVSSGIKRHITPNPLPLTSGIERHVTPCNAHPHALPSLVSNGIKHHVTPNPCFCRPARSRASSMPKTRRSHFSGGS